MTKTAVFEDGKYVGDREMDREEQDAHNAFLFAMVNEGATNGLLITIDDITIRPTASVSALHLEPARPYIEELLENGVTEEEILREITFGAKRALDVITGRLAPEQV